MAPKPRRTPKTDLGREIAAYLSRSRPQDDDDDTPGQRVPYERFQAKARQLAEMRRQFEELLDRVEELAETHEAATTKLKADSAAEVAAVARRMTEARELERLMHDPDEHGITEARRVYDSLPPNARPASPADWWKALTEETTPRTLRAYRKPEEPPADDKAKPSDKPKPKDTPRPAKDGPPKGKVEVADIMDPASDLYKKIFPTA